MRYTLSFLALGLVSSAVLADAKNPTFNDDVLPVIKQHCMNCHSNDKQRGGLNLASHAAMMQGGSSGAVVVPGDPDKSRMFTLTAHKEEPKMPPSGKIPDAQIELVRLWIEQGGKETAMSKVSMVAKPKVEIGLKNVGKGKPEGPPPMPIAGKLKLDPYVVARRPGAVLGLAASPWAPLVAVGGQKQVILLHADTGDILGMLPFEHGQINSIKFSRNAKMLLVAGGRGGMSGKAVLYNIATGEKVTEVGSAENDAILSADLSADQTMIAVGSPSKMVRVYSTADGSVLHSIKKHTDWVTAVEYSPDGVLLATGDRSGGAFVWEAPTAREFHTLRGHTGMISDLSWRPDSNLLVTASLDTTIRQWEMNNGGQVKSWAGHGAGVESVRYSMDGHIASTGRDKLTKLWDGAGNLKKQFEALPDYGLRVTVSHDNTKVIGGDWGGTLKFFAAADARVLAVADTNPGPIAEQLKAAEAAVPVAEAKVKVTSDAYNATLARQKAAGDAFNAANANLAKLQGDLAAATKAVTDTTNTINALNGQTAATKAESDKQTALLAAANFKVQSFETTAPIFADTAKRVQEAAAKAPTNPDLAAAAKAAADASAKQQADLTAAKTAQAAVVPVHKTATDKLAAHTKAITDNQAALVANQQKVATLPAMVKAATDGLPAVKKAADDANAAVGPAKAALDAATAEATAAKAKVERLKAQVPAAPAKK
ncbi:MAG: c-type cytochrome domain-containing protein [Fimbriiglobus sp.]